VMEGGMAGGAVGLTGCLRLAVDLYFLDYGAFPFLRVSTMV